MNDLIKRIKEFERKFLEQNSELYKEDRLEFLRKRDEFITEKIVEIKKNGQE